jgi:4-hydroxybenzoate polyprenyltransferase
VSGAGPSAPRRGALAEFGRFLEIQNLGLNLPFALAFFLVAEAGHPNLATLVLIVIAFVAARNAGHSFNRWADRGYDAANPRTQDRALVTGRYSPAFALGLTAVSGAVLLLAAYFLNFVAFLLAPVALALLLGYSYTKRVSAGTTVYLGLVEAVNPAAIYIAVTAALPIAALAAVGGMLLWGTAFETIHSLGDLEIDRTLGLRSLPARIGTRASTRLLPMLHASALVLFAVFGWLAGLAITFDALLAVMAVGVGAVDVVVAARPSATRLPFRAHFVLSALFLVGVLLAEYGPR